MGGIAPEYRYAVDREYLYGAHMRYGLVMAYAYSRSDPTYPALRVLDPLTVNPSSLRRMASTTFESWWSMLEAICGPTGEPYLRVVGDVRDPRRFCLAYTDAGKQWSRDRRSWDSVRRP